MKKGRLIFAAALLAVTSAFLVTATLPVAPAGGSSQAQASPGKVAVTARAYSKALQ
jgi:hypothetical protein